MASHPVRLGITKRWGKDMKDFYQLDAVPESMCFSTHVSIYCFKFTSGASVVIHNIFRVIETCLVCSIKSS